MKESKDLPKDGYENNTESDREKTKELEKEDLTASEMEVVTTIFRSFETGLRRASILPKVGYLLPPPPAAQRGII